MHASMTSITLDLHLICPSSNWEPLPSLFTGCCYTVVHTADARYPDPTLGIAAKACSTFDSMIAIITLLPFSMPIDIKYFIVIAGAIALLNVLHNHQLEQS